VVEMMRKVSEKILMIITMIVICPSSLVGGQNSP
jgi:hypothetical protein